MKNKIASRFIKLISLFVFGSNRRRRFRRNLYLHFLNLRNANKPIFSLVENPKVSVIIPVYNQFNITYNCLKSIANNMSRVAFEIIIADDGSTDKTKQIETLVEGVRVVRTSGGYGFLKNVKNAISYAKGDYLFLMNNDMIVTENWLDSLYETINQDSSVGIVGSLLLNVDGSVQEFGASLDKYANASLNSCELNKINSSKEVDYCSGCSILFSKVDWDKLGGFDEQFAPAYYEDTDFNYQMKYILGKKVVCQPESKIYHIKGATYSSNADIIGGANKKKFVKKWAHILKLREE